MDDKIINYNEIYSDIINYNYVMTEDYIFFGRFSNIWKHIPLCEFLAIEKPNSYIDTNCGAPEYQLTGSSEQQYGIFHIEKNIEKSEIIQKSVFWNILTSISENKSGISKYLGSPGFALKILGEITNKFMFFDIKSNYLKETANYAKKLNLANKANKEFFYINEDSLNGLFKMIPELGTEDFINFDPYFIHQKNDNNLCYFDVFCMAMRKGIMGMLWYGFNTLRKREFLHNAIFKSQFNSSSKTHLHGIEIMSILLSDHRLDVNPGVLGCGILIGNLSENSHQSFRKMAQEITNIYKESTMFDKYSGELRFEEFEIQV